ncbi:MAG: hypothetical protein IJU23_07480 [Proteobacteria bacterium]|nr:hypothetical protein [Pseudomonadota bacterium]
MSNDRHLIKDDGTMGNLFRRVTLATLGLDSLEDVSDQSFEVIDRADTFVTRLLGGVSNVMPKIDSENIGVQASAFADRLCEGMTGGPKSATDLGDWQYWLDAALLMLFDEDEDEEEASVRQGSGVSTKVQGKSVKANASAVRSRVAALKKSGLTPAMIQALPQSVKKSMIQELKSVPVSEKASISGAEKLDLVAEKLSSTLKAAAVKEGIRSNGSIERIFAENSRNSFVSHIADKATLVSTELSSDVRPEVNSLVERWSDSVKRLGTRSHGDMTAVREMLTALDGLEKAGAVSVEQANGLRSASSVYARHIFMNEFSRDVSKIAERAENMLMQQESRNSQPISFKAVGISGTTFNSEQRESFSRTFAALSEKLDEFSSAVKTRVLSDGETAATVRWNRAADRFARLSGISDDVDRVLLRDVAESAVALKAAGIVPAQMVDSIVAASAQANGSQSVMSTISAQKTGLIGTSESMAKAGTIGMKEVLSHFGSSKVLGDYAAKIESSVNGLVNEISKAGAVGSKLEGFITDIRQMLSTGSMSGSVSERQTFSVIESICSRLDDFAEMAASNLVTEGYDEMAMEGVGAYVSTAEESSENASVSSHTSAIETVSSIRKQAEKAISDSKAAFKAQLETALAKASVSEKAAVTEEEKHLLSELSGSASLASFIQAQKALEPHLTSEARSELTKMVESVKRSESHLAEVSKQIKLIETSTKIASSLRKAVNNSKASNVLRSVSESALENGQKTVQLGDMRVDRNYLSTLSETLQSFARIRDNYTITKTSSSVSGMSVDRLERMLSTIKPSEKVSDISKVSTESIDELVRSETVLGYDEIIPAGKEWVAQNAHYPSNVVSGDIASVLGPEKAASIHASDFVNGRVSSIQALASALERSASQNKSHTEITTYSVSDAGEAIKVSVKAENGDSVNKTFELKHSVGQAYNPASIENLENIKKSIQAKINVTRQSSPISVSGVETFIPVIAGANQTNSMALDDASMALVNGTMTSANGSAVSASANGSAVSASANGSAVSAHSSMASSNGSALSNADSASKHGVSYMTSATAFADMAKLRTIAPLSGNRTALATSIDAKSSNEKFYMSIGGVDFEMTANDFVHMVAKPTMMSAAIKQPSLMDASNILFSGYASMMSESGERRSINTLRKAYLDSLSNASRYSAHSEIGFSTESFTHLMGISSKPSFTSKESVGNSEARMSGISAQNRDYSSSSSFAADIADNREQAVSPDFVGDTNYAWVSNQVSSDIRSALARMNEAESESSHQYLSRVENMLDYVETLSERNVGVFSTDETVRVLLEALPSEGELGNKGLPKWRQRDTRATRAAEARELREALAKIGAQPVQGVQRFADRKYVSPNLLQNQESGAAPLFSSGTEGSTTPKATANSSNSGNSQFCSSSIKDEDLQFIAEEVFRKIEESLNEEHQRRRSE